MSHFSQFSLTVGQDLDEIISNWAYNPSSSPTARLIRSSDGRIVLQMRIELGVLQLEVKYRPDGAAPYGFKTYFSYLKHLAAQKEFEGKDFILNQEQLNEAIRELKQFSLRRTCWLTLGKYAGVVQDAKHCLALFQFILDHSTRQELSLIPLKYKTPNNQDSWFGFTILEQAVNFFHEILATSMYTLKKKGFDKAIEKLSQGIAQFHQWKENQWKKQSNNTLFDISSESGEQFSSFVNQWIENLLSVKRNLQSQCGIIPSLNEQLREAIRLENYEKAACLRDKIVEMQKRFQREHKESQRQREQHQSDFQKQTATHRKNVRTAGASKSKKR